MESTSLITKGMGVEIFPGYETSVSCEPMLDGNIDELIRETTPFFQTAGTKFILYARLEFIQVNVDDGSNIEGDELREKQPPDYCQAQWTAGFGSRSKTDGNR